MQVLASVAGCIAALSSILLFVRLRWPAPMPWIAKLFAGALSWVLILTGLITTIIGILTGSVFLIFVGTYDVIVFLLYVLRVTQGPGRPNDFDQAFGEVRMRAIKSLDRRYALHTRASLRLPRQPEARMVQDVPFATIPGTDRQLLCDIWQPAETIRRSGLGFIYVHGGAWYLLDKDLGTRTFFNYLSAQGHVIMDVANRLAPETDMMGMINDVKRAIVWLREHAATYRVNPDNIVVSGGSSGAHLALMAAYTINDTRFSPAELIARDTSVCGVVSIYGPSDLEAMYYHTNQHLTTRSVPGRPKKKVPTKMPAWMVKRMGKEYYRLNMDKGFVNAGAFAPLLGGHPDECPEVYTLFSPIAHVHSGCPPTLLIHGAHDMMAPVKCTYALRKRLAEEKVKTVMHILPQTDHAFDFAFPKISPSVHSAYYDVDRFLALIAQ